MKRCADLQVTLHRLLFASAIVLFVGSAADAQTKVYTTSLPHTDDVGFDDFFPNDWDGVNFQVPVANGQGNNIWGYFGSPISSPPYQTDWQTFRGKRYQFTTFSAPTGARRTVLMGVLNSNQDGVIPNQGIDLTVESLTLENVEVDPGAVQLRFDGTSFAWKMSNARYATSTNTPLFKAEVPLELSSVAGKSEIASWNGRIGSPTKLVVNPGSTLVFERVGDIGASDELPRQLFFSQTDVNTADVNGGVLQLDFSGVVFDTTPEASVVGGKVTGGFVVRNRGTLLLNGFDSSLASTRLELRGGMLVDDSTVSLNARTTIELDSIGEEEKLVLNNATVDLGSDAVLRSRSTTFGGTNRVTTAAPLTFGDLSGFRSPVLFRDAATVVNIEGEGDFFAEDLVNLNGGTLNLEMDPNTGKLISTGIVRGPGLVNVGPDNFFEINGDFDQAGAGAAKRIDIVNQGIISVRGGLNGTGTIDGTGIVVVRSDGSLISLSRDGLAMNFLVLDLDSELAIGIDPSLQKSSTVDADQLVLDSLVPSFAPVLTLNLSNDTVLPFGTKFLLVDYEEISAGSGRIPQFRGLPDGHIFQLGSNTYQIRYSDAEYGSNHSGNSSVITLTVIDTDVVDDYYTVIENGTLNVPSPGVLDNDPFFVLLGGNAQLVTGPTNGDLVLNSNGSFDYTPQKGFEGSDSFTYEVVQDGVVSDTAVVRIDVNSVETFLTVLDSLATEVDFLCVNGTLKNRGQCRSLEVKLVNARRKFISGNHRAAGNLLRAFESEVSAMERSGRISPAQAGELLRLADVCISLL